MTVDEMTRLNGDAADLAADQLKRATRIVADVGGHAPNSQSGLVLIGAVMSALATNFAVLRGSST